MYVKNNCPLKKIIYLLLVVLGLGCYVAGSRGYSLVMVQELLIGVASHCGAQALEQAGLSSCGVLA